MDQRLHRVATKKREEIKWTTKQKMARRHCKEGGNHLNQESNRQKNMEDTDGELHPDGQSLGEVRLDLEKLPRRKRASIPRLLRGCDWMKQQV